MALGSVRRALLSVYDKTGILDLARGLHELGVELLASGGTARALGGAGIPVTPVETFTGAPEVLGGRVKTLHPRIHAGILADRRDEAHLAQLQAHQYPPIDLVVCNLYPFEDQRDRGADHATLVETIDIGGPTLVRAAAKNADGGVTVVVDPSDYDAVLDALRTSGAVGDPLRGRLRARAFRHVASYDLAIAAWAESVADGVPATQAPDGLPERLWAFARSATLRYGENPHQPAALYLEQGAHGGVALAQKLSGKELSYNNYLDLDAAYRAAWAVAGDDPELHACAVIKHTNPCGLSIHEDQAEAFRRALAGDPVSAFGGILGFNHPLGVAAAEALRDAKLFVECIVAPGFDPEVRSVLAAKKDLRLVVAPPGDPTPRFSMHRIGGGVLVQETDPGVGDAEGWQVVTRTQVDDALRAELAFGMRAVALLKSNAIAVTRRRALLGAGTGQTSRVDAVRHALEKAGDEARGAVLASDAFFPFDDSVRLAAQAGIAAIAQPGGSKRDEDSIRACDELGIAMVFTGRRHFRH